MTTATITADDIWRVLEPLGFREKPGFKIDRQFELHSSDHMEYDFIRMAYDGVIFCQIHPSHYDALIAIAHLLSPTAGGDADDSNTGGTA